MVKACVKTKNKNQTAIAYTFRGAYSLRDPNAHILSFHKFMVNKIYCYPIFLGE